MAAKGKKITIITATNPKVNCFLNILVAYGLIEYRLTGAYRATIKLKYKNLRPCLKSIHYMGSNCKKSINIKTIEKELGTKKALYIVQSSQGLVTFERASHLNSGGLLLFCIKI